MNCIGLARFIRRWHARLGVTAALFFVVLIVTGVALNHTERLGLAYRSFQFAALATACRRRRFWLYTKPTAAASSRRLAPGCIAISACPTAAAHSLKLYTTDGNMIDTLTGTALPQAPLSALGRHAERLVVHGAHGPYASSDGLDWQPITGAGVTWGRAHTPAPQTIAAIGAQLTPALHSNVSCSTCTVVVCWALRPLPD